MTAPTLALVVALPCMAPGCAGEVTVTLPHPGAILCSRCSPMPASPVTRPKRTTPLPPPWLPGSTHPALGRGGDSDKPQTAPAPPPAPKHVIIQPARRVPVEELCPPAVALASRAAGEYHVTGWVSQTIDTAGVISEHHVLTFSGVPAACFRPYATWTDGRFAAAQWPTTPGALPGLVTLTQLRTLVTGAPMPHTATRTCDRCQRADVRVKGDGTLYRHKTPAEPAGEVCQ